MRTPGRGLFSEELMKIEPNSVVSIDYSLSLDSGEQVDQSPPGAPLSFVIGGGQIIPGLEKALLGKEVGWAEKVTIEPEEAYGRTNLELFQEIPRASFPEGLAIEPGMAFEAAGEGAVRRFVVKSADGDKVVADFNHPLAGERLHFDIKVVEVPAATIAELETDLAARAKSADPGLDAIILMPDIFNHCPAGWELIRRFAGEHRLPIGGSFLYTVEQGAIFGNANDLTEVGKLAAPLAEKILRGTSAGMIPVVTPEQDLWINYKAARELGLTVPEGLLQRAKKVIR